MLNFIAIGVTSWLVNGPLLARGSANSATPPIAASAELPRLLPPTSLNAGFLIALALVIAYGVLGPASTVGGFRSRLVGLNPRFSRAVGIEPGRVVFGAMIVSGALGGLAGGIHALGLVHRFVGGLFARLWLHRHRHRAAGAQFRARRRRWPPCCSAR